MLFKAQNYREDTLRNAFYSIADILTRIVTTLYATVKTDAGNYNLTFKMFFNACSILYKKERKIILTK